MILRHVNEKTNFIYILLQMRSSSEDDPQTSTVKSLEHRNSTKLVQTNPEE